MAEGLASYRPGSGLLRRREDAIEQRPRTQHGRVAAAHGNLENAQVDLATLGERLQPPAKRPNLRR